MPTTRSRQSVARRPGGRSARVVSDVLRATLEEMGRVGYGRLRIDDVAARSGVNKTTIYRRWPEKSQLVCAALKTVGGVPTDPDTGSVRADLIASFKTSLRGWATDRGRGILRVLAAERADATVDRLGRALRERYEAARRVMLERGVSRGELPAGTDVDFLLEMMGGAVHARLRHRSGPVDAAWITRVVEFSLAAASASAVPRRPSARVS